MSLKNIFDKEKTFSSITTNVNIEEIGKEVESVEYIRSYIDLSNKNLSNVDWENPEEFARYGSAEKYYEDNIENIYKTYPYDGSLKEKIDWELESPELSAYLFENRYPRYNGYIDIGNDYGITIDVDSGYSLTNKEEYISFYGTLNTSPDAKDSQEHFELSNKFDKENNRTYNLDVNGSEGVTVEFYFKKENSTGSDKQVIFDLWNGQDDSSPEYGRLRIEVHPGVLGEEDKFYIEIASGSNGASSIGIGQNLSFTSWKHYAISLVNDGAAIKAELYVNGDKEAEMPSGTAIGRIEKAVKAHIGSLITKVPGTNTDKGYGKLSGSLDEFRFWKKRRTEKQIARYYFTNVGAGVNTDDSNTHLGVYYKFNEGIVSTDSVSEYDKIILDYSGRISNGTWVGYSAGQRSTESAIVLSGNAPKEFKDPTMYSVHPEVQEILEYYKSYGKEYDLRNSNSMYNTLPDWIVEQDRETGEKIKDLIQMMSEFFDDLNLKIEALPSIKNMDYAEEEQVSFVRKLLQNVGFKNLNLLEDSTLLEEFLSRNEESGYEEKLYKVKREIYKNIYNNIINIYKSKGTSKSFRNLLHCFGIDEKLVKMKAYADNLEYTFDDRYRNSADKTKVIDFNKTDNFASTIHQAPEAGNADSLGYIPGDISISQYGTTLEACILFPKKFDKSSVNYFKADFLDVSLFGIHESDDGQWAVTDNADIRVMFRRAELDSKDGYFVLSSPSFAQEITSELVKGVYNNEKWNFALSVKRNKSLPMDVSGSDVSDYKLELYCVNTVQDIKQKSLLLSADIGQTEAESYFSANKMIYAGAHRQDFNGTVVDRTDVKVESVRFWNSYLSNDNIDIHSKDISAFGKKETYFDLYSQVKNTNTLCLHWNFETITGTDSNAEFVISDISSGSLELLDTDNISLYTKYQFTGIGEGFLPNDSSAVKVEHLPVAVRNLPDDINIDDFVNILSQDDETYTRDILPLNHFFSVEKSMHAVISQDMIDWIGTIKDFNDLIGKPKNRYEMEYRELEKLRNLFFRNVENEPDFDLFLSFYKWIDAAVLNSVLQVVPASLNMIDNVFNIYESHVLERNKYQHKLPTIEFKGKTPEGTIQSIISPNDSWKNGCLSRYNRAIENILHRNELSPILNNTINREKYLVYNVKTKEMPLVSEKKRETEIIRTRVGFDLTGLSSFDVEDLFETLKDC